MNYVINGNTYRLKGKEFKKFLDSLKKLFKGKRIIYGVGKEGTVIARNDEYDSYQKLYEAVMKWKKQGYTVFFVNNNG